MEQQMITGGKKRYELKNKKNAKCFCKNNNIDNNYNGFDL